MPRFNANLTLLFNELDFLDRFKAAKDAGFNGVEYLFPYAYRVQDLVGQLRSLGLTQVLHNLPAGDWAGGERGIACLPDRVREFQDGVGQAIDYAQALGCTQLNCLAGIAPAAIDPQLLRDTLVANLKFAADRLKRAGIRLLLEPCNTRDIPGFYLHGSRQAIEVMDAVESDNLFLQYDIYHMQVMEGNLAPTIERYIDRIGHMQLADNPGRGEPGGGVERAGRCIHGQNQRWQVGLDGDAVALQPGGDDGDVVLVCAVFCLHLGRIDPLVVVGRTLLGLPFHDDLECGFTFRRALQQDLHSLELELVGHTAKIASGGDLGSDIAADGDALGIVHITDGGQVRRTDRGRAGLYRMRARRANGDDAKRACGEPHERRK